jgi:hypothetical protein
MIGFAYFFAGKIRIIGALNVGNVHRIVKLLLAPRLLRYYTKSF